MKLLRLAILAAILVANIVFIAAARGEMIVGATVPVGTIITYAGATCPTGYLYADGSSKSKTAHKTLCAALGTTWRAGDASNCSFPDLRGAFLRGDGTGTVNTRSKTGPAVGAFQEDKTQGHHHRLYAARANGTGNNGTQSFITSTGLATNGMMIYDMGSYTTNYASTMESNGVDGTPRTGSETAPYNAGVKYCIKY